MPMAPIELVLPQTSPAIAIPLAESAKCNVLLWKWLLDATWAFEAQMLAPFRPECPSKKGVGSGGPAKPAPASRPARHTWRTRHKGQRQNPGNSTPRMWNLRREVCKHVQNTQCDNIS